MYGFISTKEAAKRLKISVRRVQALIAARRLPAEKVGNSFVIKESDLKLVNGRKNGRPQDGHKREEKDWNAIVDRYISSISYGKEISLNKERLKLIKKLSGSVKGLPSDLSTNKKYMEGFGK